MAARGRHDPSRVIQVHLDRAARGPNRGVEIQVQKVMEYILTQAQAHGGDAQQVPCPDVGQWTALSNGRRAQLPSDAQLALYCGRLRQPREELRVTVFKLAKEQLGATDKGKS